MADQQAGEPRGEMDERRESVGSDWPDEAAGRWGLVDQDWTPVGRMTVGLDDYAFMQGASLTERLRTYGGRTHRLADHLARLDRSCRDAEVWLGDPGSVSSSTVSSMTERIEAVAEVERRRQSLRDRGNVRDFGLMIVVVPGRSFDSTPPRVMIQPYDLDFVTARRLYHEGDRLVVCQTVRQIPAACWPASLKCRSRMHYHLADAEARRSDPKARGLLLHLDGTVAECGIANVVIVDADGTVISPPRERILPGVSLAMVQELVVELGGMWQERDLREEDLEAAQEMWMTSTGAAVWPVCRLDGEAVGTGRPGPTWRRLIEAWSGRVGVNLIDQAERGGRHDI